MFFRTSRSILSRWFSSRRRRSSSSAGGRLPLPGKACWPWSRRTAFQWRSCFSETPRLRAASATERPCSVISFTAASLNSRVYLRRGFDIFGPPRGSLHPYLGVHHSWGTSVESAEESNFGRPAQVLEALLAGAEVGAAWKEAKDKKRAFKPLKTAFQEKVSYKYTNNESEQTMNLYGEDRKFRHEGATRAMEKHFTLGGGDRVNCLQIYIDFDEA